jgi:2-amino-4-hydroxy-6-hydroxymethyldihydropteridine diphosphokinase
LAVVFFGLGSNLGSRRENIHQALNRLQENGVSIQKVSTFIETSPFDVPPEPAQGDFINAVAKAITDLSPQDLLKVCQSIESELGRVRTIKNGPRPIDIDILFYDDLKISTSELTIPHPRMREREFVMKPLREIAPEVAKAYSKTSIQAVAE